MTKFSLIGYKLLPKPVIWSDFGSFLDEVAVCLVQGHVVIPHEKC